MPPRQRVSLSGLVREKARFPCRQPIRADKGTPRVLSFWSSRGGGERVRARMCERKSEKTPAVSLHLTGRGEHTVGPAQHIFLSNQIPKSCQGSRAVTGACVNYLHRRIQILTNLLKKKFLLPFSFFHCFSFFDRGEQRFKRGEVGGTERSRHKALQHAGHIGGDQGSFKGGGSLAKQHSGSGLSHPALAAGSTLDD